MKKEYVSGLEKMAAGFLQYRYGLYLQQKTYSLEHQIPEEKYAPELMFYQGACRMIEAMGGEWRRYYNGGDAPEDMRESKNYRHIVFLPDDSVCKNLNFDIWEDA